MVEIAIPPVAIFVFNRPEITAQTLKAVGKARPKRLYVVVDGPRPENPEDIDKVQRVLEQVSSIDWECDVFINKSDKNLGVYRRLVTGVDWVFETESRAIFLEDDCVGSEDFFRFCAEILEQYAENPRVGSVSGSFFGMKAAGPANSYHFNTQTYSWGWATWARAWGSFAQREEIWESLSSERKSEIFRKNLPFFWQRVFWRRLVKTRHFKENWDFQWSLTQWINSRLAVEPNINLVRNIGFGQGATHTKQSFDILGKVPVKNLSFPLVHPSTVTRDLAAMRSIQTLFRVSNLTRHSKLLSRVAAEVLGSASRR